MQNLTQKMQNLTKKFGTVIVEHKLNTTFFLYSKMHQMTMKRVF